MTGTALHRAGVLRAWACVILLASLAACLPTNNFSAPATNSSSGLDGVGSGLGAAANGDGAQPPCTQFNPGTTTRSTCVACYDSILSTRCPGKTSFSSCLDPSVQTGYVSLINTCILQSTQAGFTCGVTCSNGQVIDAQTCTCVAPTPNPTGNGVANIDVGQTDFGPPIITATYPQSAVTGTPSPSPTPSEVLPGACAGSLPIYLGVQNRGDTVFRLNSYSEPQIPSPLLTNLPGVTATANPTDAETPARTYFYGATQPQELSTEDIANHPGSNALTVLSFVTGGYNEIMSPNAAAGTPGGRVGIINTISGSSSNGSTFSDGVPEGALPGGTKPGTAGGPVGSASWVSPGFGARDIDGNVYFSDPSTGIVDMICYNPWVSDGSSKCKANGGAGASPDTSCPYTGTNPLCKDVAVGTMVRVAGTAGTNGAGFSAGTYNSILNLPHGIAVDQYFNVMIADSGNHAVKIVCVAKNGACAGAASASPTIYIVAGKESTPDTEGNKRFNYPYGIDYDGKTLYVADFQNHAIASVDCSGAGGCIGANAAKQDAAVAITTIVGKGDGTPGYVADGTSGGGLTSGGAVRYPTDVKVDYLGNLVYADSRNHLIRALCGTKPAANGSQGYDFCTNVAAAGDLITIAGQPNAQGSPSPGDVGEGRPANLATIAYPRQLLLAKQYAEYNENYNGYAGQHNGNEFSTFLDNNILFTEGLWGSLFKGGFDTPNEIGGSTPGYQGMHMGVAHTCVLDKTGQSWCVGNNDDNQLGDSNTGGNMPTLTEAKGGGYTALSSAAMGGGENHTCVSNATNNMYCWGDNSASQLGIGTSNAMPSPSPVKITAGTGPSSSPTWGQVVGGTSHTCAYNAGDNKLYCFGDDSNDQLGTGTPETSNQGPTMATVPGAGCYKSDWKGASTPVFASGSNHTCGFLFNNTCGDTNLFCWGDNSLGQCGTTNNTTPVTTPQAVGGGGFWPNDTNQDWMVAAGGDHTCAWRTGNGQLFCWGSNGSGEAGTGSVDTAGKGINTPPGSGISGLTVYFSNQIFQNGQAAVALGLFHTCAITAQGAVGVKPPQVACWGKNDSGQLGTEEVPSTGVATTPVQVIGLPSGVIHGIYAGGNQTCALIDTTGSGAVPWCWGNNQYFDLGANPTGNGTLGNRVRAICGSSTLPSGVASSSGICKGVPQPTYTGSPVQQGTLVTLSGQSGISAANGAGDGFAAGSATFAKVGGLTYDRFKNLIVSDGGFTDSSGNNQFDFRLRLIYDEVVGPRSGYKYGVTDSNSQSSYWCLKLKPQTYCDSTGVCSCTMIQPTDDSDPNFWEAIGVNINCI